MAYRNNIIIEKRGFTIVELLVVIVVIGILAAITIVSFSGIADKATVSMIVSDLDNASKQMKLYQTLYGSYPTAMVGNCPTLPTNDPLYCLKSSNGTTLTYSSISPKIFHLTETKGNASYSTTDSTAPAIATNDSSSTVGYVCPTGFIPVPGSGTYGTNDFCIMKYEAKGAGNNVPVSLAAGSPWTGITQTNAIAYSANVVGCTSCHLVSEAEWMTVAQNVLSVDSNWSGGTVGSGYIFSGHNDDSPDNALAANSDANGYVGTGNYSGDVTVTNGMVGNTQRRTLTLSNTQVIWDLAGNVYEWTSGVIGANLQPGLAGESTYVYKQWNNASLLLNGLPSSSMPASTGIPNISTWSSAQGIGQLESNHGESSLYAIARGGICYDGNHAGVLALSFGGDPSYAGADVGFRVIASPAQ